MNNIIKNFLSLKFFNKINKNNKYIFLYHDINNTESKIYSNAYSTSVENFKNQIYWIKQNFKLLPLQELITQKNNLDKCASIVFDDGFKSILTNAYPYLKNDNIPFTIFINKTAVTKNKLWVTNFLLSKGFNKSELNEKILKLDFQKYLSDKSNINLDIFLNIDDLIFLCKNGVDIQNHTCNHYNLACCDNSTIEKEILENKYFIESFTNKNVEHFAIPFGKKQHYNKAVIDILKKTGHSFIYSTNPIGFNQKYNNVIIPRIGLTEENIKMIQFYINREIFKNINL